MDKATAAAVLSNPKLVSLIQGKLGTLVGQSSGYIESLPPNVRRRVAGLKGVQKEHAKLEAQFQEEVLELEKKFFTKFTPLYEKRAAIVNGKAEPSAEEIAEGAKGDEDEDDEDGGRPGIKTTATEGEDDTPMTGIPEFWLSAMKNEPSLAAMITDADCDAMTSLVDVRMQYLDKPGFKLIFEFADNAFFSNKILTKTYYYQEETGYGGDFIYDRAEGDKIDWKAEKNLTVKIESKKQRNKNTKQTRTIKKTVPCESFFNFFSPPKPPADDDDNDELVDEEIEERLELDYTLGEDIKEKLIPRAIDWFTGEALQFEETMGDDDMEGEFEDEDDEDEDDLSDDQEEDETDDEVSPSFAN